MSLLNTDGQDQPAALPKPLVFLRFTPYEAVSSSPQLVSSLFIQSINQ